MRLPEPHSQEEGLVLQLPQRLDRGGGDATVEVGLVGHVATFRAREPREIGGQLPLDLWFVAAVGRVVHDGGDAPRLRVPLEVVLTPVVEDLADAARVVAVLLEQLRQGHDVRVGLAEVGRQVGHAEGVGTQAGQQRGPRGVAEGLLGVGPVEPQPLPGESIDAGGPDDRVAVRAELDPKVVHGDEEDVQRPAVFPARGRSRLRCARGQAHGRRQDEPQQAGSREVPRRRGDSHVTAPFRSRRVAGGGLAHSGVTMAPGNCMQRWATASLAQAVFSHQCPARSASELLLPHRDFLVRGLP